MTSFLHIHINGHVILGFGCIKRTSFSCFTTKLTKRTLIGFIADICLKITLPFDYREVIVFKIILTEQTSLIESASVTSELATNWKAVYEKLTASELNAGDISVLTNTSEH